MADRFVDHLLIGGGIAAATCAQTLREERDSAAVTRTLEALVEAAGDPGHNLMPLLVDAARANITEGEIVTALQTVFGSYREAPVF